MLRRMSTRRSSPLAVLVTMLWPLFLACSALVALVWVSGFGVGKLADPDFMRWVSDRNLRAALGVFSQGLDLIWITLGAINTYLALVCTESLPTARRWCGLVLIAAFGITVASAATGFPLGPIYFPENLGIKIGPVPFALPFLWLLIVTGARETVLRVLPKLGHTSCAMLAGVLCALTSLLLDPIAWKYRAWWLWYPAQIDAPAHAPWSAHLTWLIAGSALAFLMRSQHIAPRVVVRPIAPMAGFLILNAVVLLTRLVR
jgi:uncharacterized membrane protein